MSELKSRYLDAKRSVIFTNSKTFDLFLFFCMCVGVGSFLFAPPVGMTELADEDNPLSYTYSAAQAIFEAIYIERGVFILWAVAMVANILLIVTLRGTLGMKLSGLRLSGASDKRPNFMQAIKFVLLSPLTIAINLYIVFMLWHGMKADLYVMTNAKIVLIFGTYAVLSGICIWKFGSVIRLMQYWSGLNIDFTPKRLAKIEKKFDKKGKTALYLTDKSLQLGQNLYKAGMVCWVALAVYLSVLVILDLSKKLEFEEKLYAPYAINWGENNGFFALRGLAEPANVADTYEVGRSITYQYFMKNEALRQKAKIPYSFDAPPAEDFATVDLKSEPLKFKFIWGEPTKKNFDCLTYIRDDLEKERCASFKELEETISQNKVLWDRFNQLPNYTEFQRPPINLQGRPYGEALITLARVKSAQLIMMAERGQAEEALKEWAQFMGFYRHMLEAKKTAVDTSVYMIVFNIHHKTLEKMLYINPDLAVQHFDLIKDSLNPNGVSMFRGQTMLVDDWSNIEVFMPSFGAGYAPGIRNRLYDCFVKIDDRAKLSAKQYFSKENIYVPCFSDNTGEMIFDLWFTTTGNFVTNTIYGLLHGGLAKARELVGSMHVNDTYMRMEILGAKILHDKIPVDQVADYVRNAPIKLQNPILEQPFQWDEKGKYLYFFRPGDPDYAHKFHLNLK